VVPGSGWVELGLLRTDSNRRVNVSAASLQLPGGERLLVGRDSAGQERFASALFQAGALALIAALALSVATGWMLSRLVFNRVAQIARTADTIVSGDLGQRVPLSGSGDEIDSLSLTLNRMLDRIEALVSNLRTTTDSLAHDLRSPLTRLRAQVALLVDPDLSPQGRGEIADRAQTEADHLLRVFSALTEISRAEAGLSGENFEIVDLARLAGDICDIYGPVGAERDVRIELHSTPVTLSGHAPLIAQALSNLLENALRYAPDGTVIAVTVGQAGRPCLSVADNGPGIPADQHQRVLTPFVTLDESRSARGTGLGLALVASVARLHDGQITLHDNAPGLKAILCLGPAARAGQDPIVRPPGPY
jgi:signal transduction histidine kinase